MASPSLPRTVAAALAPVALLALVAGPVVAVAAAVPDCCRSGERCIETDHCLLSAAPSATTSSHVEAGASCHEAEPAGEAEADEVGATRATAHGAPRLESTPCRVTNGGAVASSLCATPISARHQAAVMIPTARAATGDSSLATERRHSPISRRGPPASL